MRQFDPKDMFLRLSLEVVILFTQIGIANLVSVLLIVL